MPLFKDLSSFAGKFENAFVKLFNEEPKVEAVAVQAISLVAPIVVSIVAATGQEAEAAAIAAVTSTVKSELATLQVALNDAGAGSLTAGTSPTVLAQNLIKSIDANLGSLLTAGMIKDANTASKVTGFVQSISSELNVLLAAL